MTLIGRSDLPEPMYNAELFTPDGTFLGIADVWWQRAGVVAEVDSRRYHLSPDRLRAHGNATQPDGRPRASTCCTSCPTP